MKLTIEQEEQIVQLYDNGLSVRAIAGRVFMSNNTIRRVLQCNGVYTITKKQEKEIVGLHQKGLSLRAIADKFSIQPQRVQRLLQNKGKRILNVEQEEEIVKLYQEGLSLRAIAPKFHVRHESIYHMLRRRGVKMRRRIDAVNKALTIYSHDDTFFDAINTEEKAYWLGFIMADGNVYHKGGSDLYRLKIGLKKSDKAHILKLRAALNSSHLLYDVRALYVLDIPSKKLCEALIGHGVVPQKSSKELLPPQMPGELLRHFWRGYFDGDGSLYLTKNGRLKEGRINKSWGFTLLGSRTILESFTGWLWSQGLLLKMPTLHRTRPDSMTFEVKLRRESEIISVAETLYGGATIYLDRKMKKYQQLISPDVGDGQLNLPYAR